KKYSAFKVIRPIVLHFSSSFKKYLSNFFLNNTSINSFIVAFEKVSFPRMIALSNALAVVVPPIRDALTKPFVSKTKRLLILQDFLKNFFCQSTFFHCTAKSFQILQKFFFGICKLLCKNNIHLLRNLIPFLLGSVPPSP